MASASSAAADADFLMEKADKTLNAGFLRSLMGGNKYEEAEELYTKAANQYKLAKKWKEAGDAFVKSADMQIRLSERDEAAQRFLDASNAYKKSNPEALPLCPDAVNALKQAIAILTERGRFQMAAKHQKSVAEIYETDLVDLNKSMEAYEVAAEWFAGEDSTALANGCLIKVATFAAQLEQYDKAIEVFDRVAAASADNALTKWSLKDYFFKATLCHLCKGDYVGAQRALEKYNDMDMSFSTTRECTFLKSLLEALEAGDAEMYTACVVDYNRLTQLDNWKTTILLRIKNSIEKETFT
ncbi:vesicular-fusion protein S17 [Sorochytrium milnesiophthora]